jgi:uncharacterized protein YdeI (YjbR/CyaY-like superfamily)
VSLDTPATFGSADRWRAWLERHHRTETELVVRLFRTHAGEQGLTYIEALDEALCFGWIDGVRRAFDAVSFTVRFSPRKARSIWSRVNVAHVERLMAADRMTPAGLAAFQARDAGRTGVYSFEQRTVHLAPALLRRFRARARAWRCFEGRPPGYRRTAIHWVMSAKREDTRLRRLQVLIECSARGESIPVLARAPSPHA